MTHPFDVVIGLDRSDRKADLHLIHTASGRTRSQTIATALEALHDWLADLRQGRAVSGRTALHPSRQVESLAA